MFQYLALHLRKLEAKRSLTLDNEACEDDCSNLLPHVNNGVSRNRAFLDLAHTNDIIIVPEAKQSACSPLHR